MSCMGSIMYNTLFIYRCECCQEDMEECERGIGSESGEGDCFPVLGRHSAETGT